MDDRFERIEESICMLNNQDGRILDFMRGIVQLLDLMDDKLDTIDAKVTREEFPEPPEPPMPRYITGF